MVEKKLFWKAVNGVRKKKEGMEIGDKVKDINGAILMGGEKVQKRQTEYFEQLFYLDERREVEILT